jgi:uncharacterized membrane protein
LEPVKRDITQSHLIFHKHILWALLITGHHVWWIVHGGEGCQFWLGSSGVMVSFVSMISAVNSNKIDGFFIIANNVDIVARETST